MIVTISIGLALGLIGLGVIGMLVSGVLSVIKAKQDLKKIITMVIPFIVFGIAYAIAGDIPIAGVSTMLFMIAAMAVFILITGTRSTFNL
ncbi:MAG TPA: hypothetical protein VJ964_07955 [Balneolaceae bacterium]|nr:hypothetical protein [Balneolaceae bacterium]